MTTPTDPTQATPNTPASWADVARTRHAHYTKLLAERPPGDVSLTVQERILTDLVPHLVAGIDDLYADLRAAHRQTGVLGKQLVEQAASHTDTALRGSGAEAWLKARRDEHPREVGAWQTLDALLDDYRLRADTGTLLGADEVRGG